MEGGGKGRGGGGGWRDREGELREEEGRADRQDRSMDGGMERRVGYTVSCSICSDVLKYLEELKAGKVTTTAAKPKEPRKSAEKPRRKQPLMPVTDDVSAISWATSKQCGFVLTSKLPSG